MFHNRCSQSLTSLLICISDHIYGNGEQTNTVTLQHNSCAILHKDRKGGLGREGFVDVNKEMMKRKPRPVVDYTDSNLSSNKIFQA